MNSLITTPYGSFIVEKIPGLLSIDLGNGIHKQELTDKPVTHEVRTVRYSQNIKSEQEVSGCGSHNDCYEFVAL